MILYERIAQSRTADTAMIGLKTYSFVVSPFLWTKQSVVLGAACPGLAAALLLVTSTFLKLCQPLTIAIINLTAHLFTLTINGLTLKDGDIVQSHRW